MSSLQRVPPRSGASGDAASGLRAPRTAVALTVAADLHAPSAARAAVVDGLGGRVADDVLGDARLLVSELVTNSVRHAGLAADGVVHVGAEVTGGVLRLEVDDAGTAGTVAPRPPTGTAASGCISSTRSHAAGESHARDSPVSGSNSTAGRRAADASRQDGLGPIVCEPPQPTMTALDARSRLSRLQAERLNAVKAGLGATAST